MHGTRFIFEKPFVMKQHNVLIFLIVSAKGLELPIELSDCCCDLSVPIPNGYTIDQSLMLSQHSNKAAGVYIMADICKIRINNSMVPDFVMKIDHTS